MDSEYTFQGTINGIPYSILFDYVACPVPITSFEIHRVQVTLPENAEDRVTPIIESKFRQYVEEQESYKRKAEQWAIKQLAETQ